MRVSAEEIEAVLRLNGDGRFKHFVKLVANFECAWGLWDDGWALGGDDDGGESLVLWPRREYASLCAVEGWSEFEPTQIELEYLLDELIPNLKDDGTFLAIFPTPHLQGVVCDPEVVGAALEAELDLFY